MSEEDALLDDRWRRVFGQPLPMLGAPEIARVILDKAEVAGEDWTEDTPG